MLGVFRNGYPFLCALNWPGAAQTTGGIMFGFGLSYIRAKHYFTRDRIWILKKIN
jgi:hypothetical protein